MKKVKKGGIVLGCAIPIVAGATLTTLSACNEKPAVVVVGEKEVNVENWNEPATYNFTTEKQPEDNKIKVQIENPEGVPIVFDNKQRNIEVNVENKAFSLNIIQAESVWEKGQTKFDLKFTLTKGKKETVFSITEFLIHWPQTEHQWTVNWSSDLDNTIARPNGQNGELELTDHTSVLMDDQDVTDYLTFKTDTPDIQLTKDKISWTAAFAAKAGDKSCTFRICYNDEPIQGLGTKTINFHFQGTSLVGGLTNINDINILKLGRDVTNRWKLVIDEGITEKEIEPPSENVKYSIEWVSGQDNVIRVLNYVSGEVDPENCGGLIWVAHTDPGGEQIIPSVGSHVFKIHAEYTDPNGLFYEATSDEITLTMPESSFTGPQTLNVWFNKDIYGNDHSQAASHPIDTEWTFMVGDQRITSSDGLSYDNGGTPFPKWLEISADNKLIWGEGADVPEAGVSVTLWANFGIFIHSLKINFVRSIAEFVGGNQSLDFGQAYDYWPASDPKEWVYQENGTKIRDNVTYKIFKMDKDDTEKWVEITDNSIYFENRDGQNHLYWTKDLVLEQHGQQGTVWDNFYIQAFHNNHYADSRIIAFTKQNPKIEGGETDNIFYGKANTLCDTSKPYTFALTHPVEGLQLHWDIERKQKGFDLKHNEDGSVTLCWDNTIGRGTYQVKINAWYGNDKYYADSVECTIKIGSSELTIPTSNLYWEINKSGTIDGFSYKIEGTDQGDVFTVNGGATEGLEIKEHKLYWPENFIKKGENRLTIGATSTWHDVTFTDTKTYTIIGVDLQAVGPDSITLTKGQSSDSINTQVEMQLDQGGGWTNLPSTATATLPTGWKLIPVTSNATDNAKWQLVWGSDDSLDIEEQNITINFKVTNTNSPYYGFEISKTIAINVLDSSVEGESDLYMQTGIASKEGFTYKLKVDGDEIAANDCYFSLDENAPEWLHIDNGLLTWEAPPTSVLEQTVYLTVTQKSTGYVATKAINISLFHAQAHNLANRSTFYGVSGFPGSAVANKEEFWMRLNGEDVLVGQGKGEIKFTLQGLDQDTENAITISETGLISWTAEAKSDTFDIAIEYTDAQNRIFTSTFKNASLVIEDAIIVHDATSFESPGNAGDKVGQFNMKIGEEIVEPDSWTVTQAEGYADSPFSIEKDPETGSYYYLTWNENLDIGTYNLTIEAAKNGTTAQLPITLNVDTLQIEGLDEIYGSTESGVKKEYQFTAKFMGQAIASDVTFELIEKPSDELTISTNGLLSWQNINEDVASEAVKIKASYVHNDVTYSAEKTFSLFLGGVTITQGDTKIVPDPVNKTYTGTKAWKVKVGETEVSTNQFTLSGVDAPGKTQVTFNNGILSVAKAEEGKFGVKLEFNNGLITKTLPEAVTIEYEPSSGEIQGGDSLIYFDASSQGQGTQAFKFMVDGVDVIGESSFKFTSKTISKADEIFSLNANHILCWSKGIPDSTTPQTVTLEITYKTPIWKAEIKDTVDIKLVDVTCAWKETPDEGGDPVQILSSTYQITATQGVEYYSKELSFWLQGERIAKNNIQYTLEGLDEKLYDHIWWDINAEGTTNNVRIYWDNELETGKYTFKLKAEIFGIDVPEQYKHQELPIELNIVSAKHEYTIEGASPVDGYTTVNGRTLGSISLKEDGESYQGKVKWLLLDGNGKATFAINEDNNITWTNFTAPKGQSATIRIAAFLEGDDMPICDTMFTLKSINDKCPFLISGAFTVTKDAYYQLSLMWSIEGSTTKGLSDEIKKLEGQCDIKNPNPLNILDHRELEWKPRDILIIWGDGDWWKGKGAKLTLNISYWFTTSTCYFEIDGSYEVTNEQN